MFKRKCKITYIRHGATQNTEANRLSDDENFPPLNEKGRIEIEKLSSWLMQRSPKVDKIYTSTSLRTLQTARLIAKRYKCEFEVVDGLEARHAGLWSGYTFEQIEEKYPEFLNNYHKDNVNYWVKGGENTIELNKRVKKIIDGLIEKNLNKRIIVITHGEVIQSAVSQALEIPPKHQAKIYIPTGSATQVSYYKDWNSLVYSGYMPL